MTPYGIIISHETFVFFRYKHKRQRLVCILRKYKRLLGYSMVYHSKATDGARLAEMARLSKMFEMLGSIFFEVTRRIFAKLISEDILFQQQSTFSVFTYSLI